MRSLLCIFAAFACLAASARAHPLDAPHAELRYRVEGTGVTLWASLNLALLDTFVSPGREWPDALGGEEPTTLGEAVRAYFETEPLVTINGVPVAGVVEDVRTTDDPDPAVVGLCPDFGARALIRVNATVRYPSPEPPERVVLSWRAFPPRGSHSGQSSEPVVIEAQLGAAGMVEPVRFSRDEPTVVWSAGPRTPLEFEAVPPVRRTQATAAPPTAGRPGPASVVLWTLAGLAGVSLAAPSVRTRAAVPVVMGALALTGAGFGARLAKPGEAPTTALVRPAGDEAVAIANALHHNLYCAFGYTDGSDVFDALARSAHGQVIETLYDELHASFAREDNGGGPGVISITGLEQIDTSVTPAEASGAFRATIRWRFDGTVCQAGDTHAVACEYTGTFGLAPVDGVWKVTSCEIGSRRRVDPVRRGGVSVPPPGVPVGEI